MVPASAGHHAPLFDAHFSRLLKFRYYIAVSGLLPQAVHVECGEVYIGIPKESELSKA